MKKQITSLAIGTLMAAAFSATAFAAANGCPANYTLCSVEDCIQSGYHDHNGTTYSGHHSADGHTYHTGTEQHNSTGHHNRQNKSGSHHQ